MDISSAWRTAKVLLGENINLAPTVLKTTSANGEVEMMKNPKSSQTLSTISLGEKYIC